MFPNVAQLLLMFTNVAKLFIMFPNVSQSYPMFPVICTMNRQPSSNTTDTLLMEEKADTLLMEEKHGNTEFWDEEQILNLPTFLQLSLESGENAGEGQESASRSLILPKFGPHGPAGTATHIDWVDRKRTKDGQDMVQKWPRYGPKMDKIWTRYGPEVH